jgi:hypothetical protein
MRRFFRGGIGNRGLFDVGLAFETALIEFRLSIRTVFLAGQVSGPARQAGPTDELNQSKKSEGVGISVREFGALVE